MTKKGTKNPVRSRNVLHKGDESPAEYRTRRAEMTSECEVINSKILDDAYRTKYTDYLPEVQDNELKAIYRESLMNNIIKFTRIDAFKTYSEQMNQETSKEERVKSLIDKIEKLPNNYSLINYLKKKFSLYSNAI